MRKAGRDNDEGEGLSRGAVGRPCGRGELGGFDDKLPCGKISDVCGRPMHGWKALKAISCMSIMVRPAKRLIIVERMCIDQ